MDVAVCDEVPEDKNDFEKLGTAEFRDNSVKIFLKNQ